MRLPAYIYTIAKYVSRASSYYLLSYNISKPSCLEYCNVINLTLTINIKP